jgi:hypothetical protein
MRMPRQWQDRETSPERNKIRFEPKPKATEQKVPVVYYLSWNGQLKHPHFIENGVKLGVLAVMLLGLYIIVYSPGMGTVPCIVNAEIYPLKYRGGRCGSHGQLVLQSNCEHDLLVFDRGSGFLGHVPSLCCLLLHRPYCYLFVGA